MDFTNKRQELPEYPMAEPYLKVKKLSSIIKIVI